MENSNREKLTTHKKTLYHTKGITCFDKKTERTFFFILTIIMVIGGILAKLGIL